MTRIETTVFPSHSQAILGIRFAVFVEEQGVDPILEIDGLDAACQHVIAWEGTTPIATGRIQKDGHIGRVAVLPAYRRQGIGSAVMKALVDMARSNDCSTAWLSSQVQAAPFYEKLGFRRLGTPYLEAGIDHIDMELPLKGVS